MINAFSSGNYFTSMKPVKEFLPEKDPFNELSDEIILQVLKWLPKKTLLRCALINRRFSRIVNDESLWTRLDLGCKILMDGVLATIISRGVVILRLAQSSIYDTALGLNCGPMEGFESKLQYLDLSMARISPAGLEQLLTHCRQLKKLSLEHVQLNEAVCEQIARNADLEALNFALCEGMTVYGLKVMFSNLNKLQSLNMGWTSLATDELNTFCTHVSPSVLRLNISGCRKTMNDAELEKLVSRLPNLRELDLSDCTLLSKDIIDILLRLKHLEYLSLSRCYKLAYRNSYLELRSIKTLQYLDVFGTLSDQTLDELTKAFHPVGVNKFMHSAVARPTVGTRRTSIWGLRTRN